LPPSPVDDLLRSLAEVWIEFWARPRISRRILFFAFMKAKIMTILKGVVAFLRRETVREAAGSLLPSGAALCCHPCVGVLSRHWCKLAGYDEGMLQGLQPMADDAMQCCPSARNTDLRLFMVYRRALLLLPRIGSPGISGWDARGRRKEVCQCIGRKGQRRDCRYQPGLFSEIQLSMQPARGCQRVGSEKQGIHTPRDTRGLHARLCESDFRTPNTSH